MELAVSAQTDQVTNLVTGNTAFAFDLYGHLAKRPGNLIVSPLSISTCLGMTYAGARGNSETQMRQVLRFPDDQGAVHSSFASLQQQLNDAGKGGVIQLDIANALWAQKGDRFLPAFMKIAEGDYLADVKRANFLTSPDAARREINDWVARKTSDKIQDILSPGSLDDHTALVLVNAIYFKASWAVQFPTALTSPERFYVSTDKPVNAPFMCKMDRVLYAATEDLQILELPYAGKEFSMMILLPTRTDGLAEIEKQLSPDFLHGCARRLIHTGVQIQLPKFKMESHFLLNDPLAKMGMPDAFQPGQADFSGMDGTKELYISDVTHQAWVDVAEEGTEVAAATVVRMESLGRGPLPPVEFRADHPFLFLIGHRRTRTILFIGRVANPTLH